MAPIAKHFVLILFFVHRVKIQAEAAFRPASNRPFHVKILAAPLPPLYILYPSESLAWS